MDPDACLAKIRLLQRNLFRGIQSQEAFRIEAMTLAEAVEDLDAWLTKGGFAPTEWERPSERMNPKA